MASPGQIFGYVAAGIGLFTACLGLFNTIRIAYSMREINYQGRCLFEEFRAEMDGLLQAERNFDVVLARPHRSGGYSEEMDEAVRSVKRHESKCSMVSSKYDKLYKEASSSCIRAFLWRRAQRKLVNLHNWMQQKRSILSERVATFEPHGRYPDSNAQVIVPPQQITGTSPYQLENSSVDFANQSYGPRTLSTLPQRPLPIHYPQHLSITNNNFYFSNCNHGSSQRTDHYGANGNSYPMNLLPSSPGPGRFIAGPSAPVAVHSWTPGFGSMPPEARNANYPQGWVEETV